MNKFLKSILIIGLIFHPLSGKAEFFRESYKEDKIGLFSGLGVGSLAGYGLYCYFFPKEKPEKAPGNDQKFKNPPTLTPPSSPNKRADPLKQKILKWAGIVIGSLGAGILTAYGVRWISYAEMRTKGNEGGLHQAAYEGYIDQVKRFVRAGADVNKIQKEIGIGGEEVKRTPLHMAVSFPSFYIADKSIKPEIVRVLVKAGANLEAKYHKGETALYKAFHGKQLELIQTLLELGADFKFIAEKDGKTALSQSIFPDEPHFQFPSEKPNVEVIKALLKAGADPEEKDAQGKTLLYQIVIKGPRDLEIVKVLLEAGASPHLKCGKTQKSSFYKAVSYGRSHGIKPAFLRLLMNAKGDRDFNETHQGKRLFRYICHLKDNSFISPFLSYPDLIIFQRDLNFLVEKGKEDLLLLLNPEKFIEGRGLVCSLIQAGAYKTARKCKGPLNLRGGITPFPLKTRKEIRLLSWLWKKGATLRTEDILDQDCKIGESIAQVLTLTPGKPGSAWAHIREKVLYQKEKKILTEPLEETKELSKEESFNEEDGKKFLIELERYRRANRSLKIRTAAAIQPSPNLRFLPLDLRETIRRVTTSQEVYDNARY